MVMIKTLKKSRVALEQIVKTINNGGLVILPTRTVYVASVDPLNSLAVKKLCEYKNRPLGKPFTIAVNSIKMADEYAELNDTARNLHKLSEPPTVVSKGKHVVAPGIESETGTLGIIIPNSPLLLDIISKRGKPITVPSANASYQKRPYAISDILNNISNKQRLLIDLIIDSGKLPRREPSTVIDTTLDDPVILRQGDFKLKDKNEVLSRSEENTQNVGKELFQKYESYLGQRPIIFALEGPMGAGKTQFTKGLARAMGISEEVISPTYNLEIDYQSTANSNQLYHIDAWRMKDAEELESLSLKQILNNQNAILAIEWADRVSDAIRNHSEDAVIIWVNINYGKKENERLISWGIL
jgi:L-threonylcarbamoyladenylate synthase